MNRFTKQKSAGFTLMEVMITVAILAVLAVFAMSNYRHYIVKARLQEAQSALNANRLYLEKQYAKFNGYKKNASDFIETDDLPIKETGNAGAAGYRIVINNDCSVNDGSSEATKFCLVAIPQGGQENASGGGKECGNLTVDQAGKYVATNDPNHEHKCFK